MEITKEDIQKLLKNYLYFDWRKYKNISLPKQKSFFLKKILQYKNHPQANFIYIRNKSGEISNLAILTPKPWDSNHFGIRIASIPYIFIPNKEIKSNLKLIYKIGKIGEKQGYDLIWTKVDSSNIYLTHLLQQKNFKYITTLQTYQSTRHKKSPKIKSIYKVRKAINSDIPILKNYAERFIKINRFSADPNLPKNKIAQVYKKWVENSSKNETSEEIIVAVDKNDYPVGFITHKFLKELEIAFGIRIIGHGLMAVHPRAKGAGSILIKNRIEKLSSKYYGEYDSIIYNYDVINLWIKFGFRLIRTKHIFHLWLK